MPLIRSISHIFPIFIYIAVQDAIAAFSLHCKHIPPWAQPFTSSILPSIYVSLNTNKVTYTDF